MALVPGGAARPAPPAADAAAAPLNRFELQIAGLLGKTMVAGPDTTHHAPRRRRRRPLSAHGASSAPPFQRGLPAVTAVIAAVMPRMPLAVRTLVPTASGASKVRAVEATRERCALTVAAAVVSTAGSTSNMWPVEATGERCAHCSCSCCPHCRWYLKYAGT